MSVYRQALDETHDLESCDHVGTLHFDHEKDLIRCTHCQCAWWPIRDWDWFGSHQRVVRREAKA